MDHIQGVADRIRDRFRALGYWKHDRPDVRRFCEKHGYTTQYVYGWLQGRRPSFSYVTRLAADLGVSVEWLALGNGDDPSEEAPPNRRRPATSVSSVQDMTKEPVTPKPVEGERGRGKVIEHPLARVGVLVERLAKSDSELQSTVRAWRDSEARFRKIFEDGPLGMVIFDPKNLHCVGVNQRFAEMLGYASAEMVGRHMLDFTHPDDITEGVASIGKIVSGDMSFASRECRYVRKAGGVIWGDTTSIVVRNDAGDALYGVKMIQDVTERKSAEERLQSLFAGVPVGLYRSTPEGGLLDVNPALLQVLRYPDRESLLAVNAAELYVDLEDFRRWSALLERDGIARDFEKQLRRRDGAIIWVRDSARAVCDGAGRVVSWEGAVEDITARKRAEDATRALAQVGRELAATLDLARTTEQIVTAVLGLLRVYRSALFQLDRASGSLVCVAAAGAGNARELIGRTMPADVGVAGLAIRQGEPAWSADVLEDPRFVSKEPVHEGLHTGEYRSGLGVPLTAGGEVLGVLTIGDVRGRLYHEEELRLASAFADQAALALRNARLYEEAGRGRREAEVLADLAGTISASLDYDSVLQRIAEGAKELCGSDLARIALRDPRSGAMVITHWAAARYDGYHMHPIEAGKGTGGQVLATGRPFRTDHYSEDPRVSKDYQAVTEFEGIVAEISVPIRSGNRIEGLLYVSNRAARRFTDRDEAILLRLADHAATAIRNARLFREAERRRSAAESLAEVSRVLSQSLNVEEVGERVVESVRALLGTGRASLLRLEPGSEELRVVADSGEPQPTVERDPVAPRGADVVGVAVQERSPIATPDVLADPRMKLTLATRAEFAGAADRAMLAVPLIIKDLVIGALSVQDRTGRIFEVEEIQLAQAIAVQAALALENAKLFEEAQRRRKAAEGLADVGRLISGSLRPEDVGRRIVDSALSLLGVKVSALCQLERESGNLVSLAAAGDIGPASSRNLALVPGVAGLAVRERRAVVTPDPLADARITYAPEVRARLASAPRRVMLAVPLLIKGAVIGALVIGDQPGRAFNDGEIRLAEAFADQAALALENARLFAETQAQRDRLLVQSEALARQASPVQ